MSQGTFSVGKVDVSTTVNRGFTPEEIAERCLRKIIKISDNAPPVIRDQARAFENRMRPILVFYMKEAIRSDRTTLGNKLREAGLKTIADNIHSL